MKGSVGKRITTWVTGNRVWRSLFRHDLPHDDLGRMQTMFTNFFLHLVPARVHFHSLRPGYTLGLGVISLFLFAILVVTGVLLMFFYVPWAERAYHDMKDLEFAVSYGVILRNMHRWAAHAMVAVVFLHMVRVFYTGSYKQPREFNWVLGVLLWLLTLGLSFTGYLLPWDQLAFWAITVGTSIASYPPWIGKTLRVLLLGGNTVGQGALLRFYVLHVIALPVAATLLLAVHLWRVRKDGGLSRPLTPALPAIAGGVPDPATKDATGPALAEYEIFPPFSQKTYGLMELAWGTSPVVETQAPEEEIPSWPHLTFRLLVLFVGVLAVMSTMAYFFDAPLEELANPTHPPNPAKAPWYFLGLQELVSYSALVGGVVVPALLILGLMSIPYVDLNREGEGIWFTSQRGRRIALACLLGTAPLGPLLIYLNGHFGARLLWPEAPQAVVDLLNPGSLLLFLIVLISLMTWRVTGSRRAAAIALFSAFLSAYVILMIIGTFFRGPNWVWVWPWQAGAIY
jgi:quinol-cytochrome oxidoreductase complex cytochrome b subunit